MSEQRQSGAPIGDGITDPEPRVAHGDRRDVRFEPDEAQIVRAVHYERPAQPLPQQLERGERPPPPQGPPVEDVAVMPDDASVWDARPPGEEEA